MSPNDLSADELKRQEDDIRYFINWRADLRELAIDQAIKIGIEPWKLVRDVLNYVDWNRDRDILLIDLVCRVIVSRKILKPNKQL